MTDLSTLERRASLKIAIIRSIANEEQSAGHMDKAAFWRRMARGHVRTIRLLRAGQ